MKIFKQFPEQAIELESKPFSQEAYLEGFLLDNEGLLEISQKDEGNLKILDRQVSFPNSRKRIDILAVNLESKRIKLIEVKKERVDRKDLRQICRYKEKWRKDCDKILDKYKDILKEEELPLELDKYKEADAIIVAPEFNLREEELKNSNIQGIIVQRYALKSSGEVFIFIDYFPPLKAKWQKVPISREEFWRENKKHKNEVEEILNELENKEPDISRKYWRSCISIYKGNIPIAWYIKGDKTMTVRENFKPRKDNRIELKERKKIITSILEARRKAEEF